MKFKCLNCDGDLIYDIATQQLRCKQCLRYFDVSEYEKEEQIRNGAVQKGQKSKESRPEWIIPFKVTRKKAEKRIKRKIKLSFFAPKKMRKFEADMVYPLYVPFILYNIDYKDKMVIGDVYDGEVKYFHYGKVACSFRNLTVDVSKKFSDSISERLEPYDMNEMVEFRDYYLAGIDAKFADVSMYQLDRVATERARALFEPKAVKAIVSKDPIDNRFKSSVLHYSNPLCKIEKRKYALLPVWFFAFHEDKEEYTFMVNGQTGKIVGAMPVVNTKKNIILVVLVIIFAVAGGIITYALYVTASDVSSFAWHKRVEAFQFCVVTAIGALVASAKHNFAEIEKGQELTKEKWLSKMLSKGRKK